MAYSDLSFFLPQQQYYRNPQDYTKAMKNAALMKSQYLAQMDIELQQLDEAKRQFDKRLSYDYSALSAQKSQASEANSIQKMGTLGGLAVGAAQLGMGFLQNRQNLDWAERMDTKLWNRDNPSSSSAVETNAGFDFGGSDPYSPENFNIDSIDTDWFSSSFSNEMSSYSDPLLDYEFDFNW